VLAAIKPGKNGGGFDHSAYTKEDMPLFRSRLFWQAFLSLLLGLLICLPVFYGLTVPQVNRLAYEVEEKAARTVLDNVVQMVSQSHRDLESWRQTALDAHKRQLKNVVLLVESWARQLEADVAAGRLSRAAARRELLGKLRHLRYGNNDYLWAVDYRYMMLSHASPDFQDRDFSTLRDVHGQLVMPPMVDEARAAGESYHSYWWRRLDTGQPAEKLSYSRDFPAWQLVIGTGVYIDDLAQEVARRRQAIIDDLRRHLHTVKVSGSGYVFVIDGGLNVIVHPDARVEGSSMASLIDPASGRPLGQEFIDAAGRPDKTLVYQWNRPDDAERFSYEKVAWVHRIPEYDWYLGASAYTDDLSRSGRILGDRILLAFALGLLVTVLIAFIFVRSVTAPILRLAEVARRNVGGDLSAVSDIERGDEIGALARAFNNMVARLKEQIGTLEQRVAERTRELAEWAGQLEQLVAARTAEARASEAKFRALVDQSLAGIYIIEGGHMRYANQEMAAIFGYASPQDMVGRVAMVDLIAPEDRARVAENVRRRVDGEVQQIHYGFTGLKRDGSRVELEVHGRSFEFEGRPAVIGILLDITDRKHAEKARDAALAAAEQLSRLKSEFIANMSHELRTPLHGVIGLAHVGRRAKDLAKAQETCGRVAESGQRLLELVTDVLDFSSLESGKLELEPTAFDLADMVEAASAACAGQAEAKGMDFRLALSPELPRHYRGDASRLAQILKVLLDNAAKFTDHGRIALSVGREGEDLIFAIADTGIGMTSEQIRQVFRPFEQVDGSMTRRHGGMGLGLALAQRLAVLMGGTLRVDSRIGEGSRFELRLPLADACDAAVPQGATAPGPGMPISA
jgi:two-component system, cell cycle sensor histidine kinase and response regulator CckA